MSAAAPVFTPAGGDAADAPICSTLSADAPVFNLSTEGGFGLYEGGWCMEGWTSDHQLGFEGVWAFEQDASQQDGGGYFSSMHGNFGAEDWPDAALAGWYGQHDEGSDMPEGSGPNPKKPTDSSQDNFNFGVIGHLPRAWPQPRKNKSGAASDRPEPRKGKSDQKEKRREDKPVQKDRDDWHRDRWNDDKWRRDQWKDWNDWRKDEWRKGDWHNDDWKTDNEKDDWRNSDRHKDDWSNDKEKDEWRNSDWHKDDWRTDREKGEWQNDDRHQDDWRKDTRKDEWRNRDGHNDDWTTYKEKDEWRNGDGHKDDWRMDEWRRDGRHRDGHDDGRSRQQARSQRQRHPHGSPSSGSDRVATARPLRPPLRRRRAADGDSSDGTLSGKSKSSASDVDSNVDDDDSRDRGNRRAAKSYGKGGKRRGKRQLLDHSWKRPAELPDELECQERTEEPDRGEKAEAQTFSGAEEATDAHPPPRRTAVAPQGRQMLLGHLLGGSRQENRTGVEREASTGKGSGDHASAGKAKQLGYAYSSTATIAERMAAKLKSKQDEWQ
eukprot:gnl/TRDRNA2_/TRDRNA2_136200_c0_seq1.p1 gnl/TRDRNA2_/TRDRNA2_136200_c0~~gnl/TRDRNA2_/TRDRNA2_136200_c0_seq1.p1  ORF type:complete len:606 (-),score=101.85 gnl/TRDRNA2_/TRDRNA2_136200_c0_seq1:237-1883(-)